MTGAATKPYADVGIIVPLREEFQRLEAAFPVLRQIVEGITVLSELSAGSGALTVVAALQSEMGKSAAIRTTEDLLAAYEVGAIIVVGIAGGLSGDASIGDICISTTIVDVLDNAKIIESEDGSAKTQYQPKFYPTDSYLSFAIKYISVGLDTKDAFETWQVDGYAAAEKLIPGEFKGKGGKNEKIGIPEIYDGCIVCGSVAQSSSYTKDFQNIDRKILAIETEAGGVCFASSASRVPVVAIRGICDYADKNKKVLEEQTENKARKIAADNVFSFLKLQFDNPQLRKYLGQRRDGSTYQGSLLSSADAEAAFCERALTDARAAIHAELTLLSPEYHGKPEGYRLPLPRVKGSDGGVSVGPAIRRYTDPTSILEAIASSNLITLDVPRSYPDRSLPWVIASSVANIEIDGKQALPIIIDGDSIKPLT